jgi:hypothetical protein
MPKNSLVIVGAIMALLGLAGFAIPIITTQETREVARIGELKIQATENRSFAIPPLLSGGAMALGVFLIGLGIYGKR